MKPLSELADRDTVSKIVVFIADSLRHDHLPAAIRKLGVTARTISPSTFTGSSIPAMMTGTYPAKHKVWEFDDTLPAPPVLLQGEARGLMTQYVWEDLPAKQRPPLRTLRLTDETTLSDVSGADSSLVVVHDRGAHGPYNYTNCGWEDSGQFFSDHARNREQLRTRYRQGAESAGERFLDIVEACDLEETLLVFTSDHGELLGERKRGGVFGHGSPVCPELVSVPTVFIGTGLPTKKRLDTLLSGVDLAPTLLAAQGRAVPDDIEGVDCWSGSPSGDRIIRSEMWAHGGSLTYGACSVWDEDGGVVRHRGTPLRRIAFGYHRKVFAGAQAPAIRSLSPGQNWHLIRSFGRTELNFGTPSKTIRTHLVDEFTVGDADYDVDPPDSEQLEALGYIQ